MMLGLQQQQYGDLCQIGMIPSGGSPSPNSGMSQQASNNVSSPSPIPLNPFSQQLLEGNLLPSNNGYPNNGHGGHTGHGTNNGNSQTPPTTTKKEKSKKGSDNNSTKKKKTR